MRELSGSYSIEYLEIPEDALIVVIGLKTFTWDASLKGNDIEVRIESV